MPTTTAAYAAPSTGAKLEPFTISRRDVRGADVSIDIKYTGVCHTDLLQTSDGWGPGLYPMVPGHEITGVVTEVGPQVTKFAVGDRVGVGTYIDSCGQCAPCRAGLEVYCEKGCTPTYNAKDKDGETTQGGYSKEIVVDERYVLRIPDSLPLDASAPLLCAGITTYSPLAHWNAGPGKKVAILGMGGLGHIAIQLAHAMGAEVTVLSRTLSKKEDGLTLGADHYYATEDPETFAQLAGTFDLILCTISGALHFDQYLNLLKLDGTLINVGAPDNDITMNNWALIPARRSYAASSTGGMPETQQMLDFCAEHQIKAQIETIEMQDINDAFERLDRSQVRYRFVIDMTKFQA
ncbi:NAD(P)-dependent alcohol dehydrogenase [Streptomyces olivaceus]|uniref:NAD(P)-dependent alcohol dehydrogenase n=1 Tax=Streptomyces TaxID=1883 RepID=UPI0004C9B590|nr:NAD(P)-dependent alcohol dehydrogenase [Streptomyces olivaceus]MBZ6105453.1 NAD(P)-dependent alcohol dehydrogenase [Streptomyces olivaceus]MBZ6288429.1 NAD(P)-dependent alcohol dehydrogenase [Streptomyces olivaceus]